MSVLLSVDRVLYKEDDLCVTTGLSLNGLLFISPRKHLDALVSESTQNQCLPASLSHLIAVQNSDYKLPREIDLFYDSCQ